MISTHIETIFCDDIRQEINGKVSFIGTYAGSLFVNEFPATLPKLCLSIRTVNPLSEPLESLHLKVFLDDELLKEIVLDSQQLVAEKEIIEKRIEEGEDLSDKVQMNNFLMFFSPFQIDNECTIRVRSVMNGEEFKGIGLLINKKSDQD